MYNYLQKMNEISVTVEELLNAADEVHALPIEDRNMEGRMFVMARLYEGQPFKAMAIDQRLIAMSEIIDSGDLPGWALPMDEKGSIAVAEPVWKATATEKLVLKNEKATFNKESFLKMILSLAQTEGSS